MARYRYEPREQGWIVISDMWNERIAAIDCSAGGAQRVFEDLCRDFERAGWEFGQRYFDNVHMRRNGMRWEISIGGYPYGQRHGRGWAMQPEHGRS